MSMTDTFRLPLARALAISLLLASACTDRNDGALAPGRGGKATLSVIPQFMSFGASDGAPINHIRVTTRMTPGNVMLDSMVIAVDPNAADWRIDIDFVLPDGRATNVTLTIELLHVDAGSEVVEWSGVSTVSVVPGQPQEAVPVQLFSGPPGNLTITGVHIIAPSVLQLVEGSTTALTAIADGASGIARIFWSTLDPGTVSVSSDGAVAGLLPGAARIIATAGPRADTLVLTVTQRVAAIQITPDNAVITSLGSTQTFRANVLDPRGAQIVNAAVTWRVADAAIARHRGSGEFEALSAGETTVSATSLAMPSVTASAKLIVGQRVASIRLAPMDRTLTAIGGQQLFTAVAEDATGNIVPAANFSWASSNPGVARVDNNGRATAVGEGTTAIRAATPAQPGVPGDTVFATATLTVSQSIALVTVRPSEVTLRAIGEVLQLAAQAFDGNAVVRPDTKFNWLSIDPSIASVDSTGKVTALAAGTVLIRAETGGVSGYANVEVKQQTSVVTITPQYVEAELGEVVQFSAVARDANSVPLANQATLWSTSDTSIATITATGLATVRGYGTATINATIAGVTAHASLAVPRPARTVIVTPQSATLNARGDTLRLSAAVTDSLGTAVPNAVITWITLDASVADVSATGLVTAGDPGTTSIRAVSENAQGESQITVLSHAPVATVEVTPANGMLRTGATLALTAVARDVQNNAIAGVTLAWSSSDTSIATVSSSGLVNGRTAGTVEITATADGRSATALIVVYVAAASALAKVSGDAQTGTVSTRLPQPLVVRVDDQFGIALSAQRVIWVVTLGGGIVSSDTVVTDAQGLARTEWLLGPSAGNHMLEASAGDITGSPASFTATAVPGPIASISVSPASDTLAAGSRGPFTATAADSAGNIISGVVFAWSSADTTIAVVDGTGRVTARLAGVTTITATANGVDGTATVTVIAGPAAVLSSWNGNGQPGAVGMQLGDSLVVQVTDVAGNPVSGIAVQWAITSGDGSATPATSTTGVDGLAATSWTLGPLAGTQTLEARVTGLAGSPVEFIASAFSGSGILRTWVGGVATAPSDWSAVDNWMPAGIPGALDTVFIEADAPNQPALSGNAAIAKLIIETGAIVDLSGYQLTVHGNVDALGAVINVGSLIMDGANVTVQGSISELDVQGTVRARGALDIASGLTLNSGDFSVGGQTVTVGGAFTAGGGTLTMTSAADQLNVQGATTFYAIDETGKLTAGTLRAAGDFSLGCYNDTEFISTGTRLVMNGSSQMLSMACSSSTGSRLQDLSITAGATVTVVDNPVFVASTLTVNGRLIISSGALIDVAGPPGSVTINSGGVIDNNGTLKANLPINGTVNGNPAIQR